MSDISISSLQLNYNYSIGILNEHSILIYVYINNIYYIPAVYIVEIISLTIACRQNKKNNN